MPKKARAKMRRKKVWVNVYENGEMELNFTRRSADYIARSYKRLEAWKRIACVPVTVRWKEKK